VQDNQGLANVYRLYDRGVNERIEGRYEQATKTLLEATNSYSSTKKGLTLEAMIDYELGQAAEANNNYSVAADAYTRSLRIKPNLVEAAVRLASMLMKAGQPQAALSRARDAVAINPMDPRAHQILALVLDKNGMSDAAKAENDTAMRLMRSGSSANTDPIDRTPVEPTDQAPSPSSMPMTPTTPVTTPTTSNTSDNAPTTNSNMTPAKVPASIPEETSKPKSPAEPVDSDVMP
jgi:tetratricopeptide (TPR) repeat protein